MNNSKRAYTMIELIIVIWVLVVLSTALVIAFTKYMAWVRDANRISQLEEISSWLELYKIDYTLPLPEDRIEVLVNWEVISYEWYIWNDILEKINYSWKWIDPKDEKKFNYYLTSDKKYFQLLAFLEEGDNDVFVNNIFSKTYASNWYSERFPFVVWNNIWIITDENNNPINEVFSSNIDLSLTNSWTLFKVFVSNKENYILTWSYLNDKLYSLTKPWLYWTPESCPSWFIWVPWDITFNQKWFCVAEYEMTYEDWTWTPDWSSWNTYNYNSSKKIASKIDYPVTNLTQQEAINACETLWPDYHLITNNEWMTIARNIEFVSKNWSDWIIWSWYIKNWNSKSTTIWCDDHSWINNNWTMTWSWNIECNEKRIQKLSNWFEIWDFSWNVWEHVNKSNTLDWSDYNLGNTNFYSSGWDIEWNSSNIDNSERNNYWPLFWINSDNWMWRILSSDWVSDNIFIRSWSYTDTESAWIYSIDLSKTSSSKSENIWFRCSKTVK